MATFALVASIVSAVTSVVSLAMTLSMDSPKAKDTGSSVDRKGIDNPKLVPFGTTRLPCSRVWSNVQNTNTRWLAQQYAISVGQIKQVHNVYIDEVSYVDGHPEPDYWYGIKASKEFPNACMGIRLGKEKEQAWQQIINHSDGEWSAEHRGDRTASIALLVERWINEGGDNNIRIMSPNMKIEALVDGVAVIDPRFDIALEGANNWKKRTWINGDKHSFQNPACVMLTYLVDTYYGMKLPVDCIDVQSFIELANYCDSAGIKFNGYVDQSSDFGKTLLDMASSFDGIVYLEDGLVKVKPDRLSLPVAHILESDCVGSFRLSNGNDSNYYNVVKVEYTNSNTSYSNDKYVLPANINTDNRIKQDGFEKVKTIDMPFTCEKSGNGFVKTIANRYLKRVDYQKTIEFDLDNTKKTLHLYDVFTVTNAAYKLNKKQFRVDSIKTSLDDKTMISKVVATEYEPSVYDGNSYEDGTTSKPVKPPTLVIQSPVSLAFTQTGYTTTGTGRLTWTSRYQKEHRTVVEYKLSSASSWYRAGEVKGNHFDVMNLRPDNYDFRVMTQSFNGSSSNWTVLSNVKIQGGVLLPTVTGLKAKFDSQDCLISWNDMTTVKINSNGLPISNGIYTVNDLFSHYEIQVYKGSNNQYKETLTSTVNNFVYTYDMNAQTDVNRDLQFKVFVVAKDGSTSQTAGVVDAFNKQAPQPVAVEVDGVLVNLAVKWDHPNINDYAATEVHISNVAGFTPSINTLAATSVSPFITINRQYNGVHYCRVGHYDVFGKDGIAWSAPITFTMKDIDDVLEDSPLFDTTIGDLNDAINNGLGDLAGDLNAAVGDLNTSIGNLNTELDAAVGDLNASIDGVVGDLNTNVGNLTDKINTSTKALTDKINSEITAVSADIIKNAKAIASNKTSIGTNAAKITENKTAITGVAGNLASFESETAANFGAANAAINSNKTAIANTDKALSAHKTEVTAKFKTTDAAIATNSQAVTDANKAIANQNTALTAKINSNTASINSNKTAIADTNKTVTSLQSSVNAKFAEVEADITSNSNAIADANNAIVNQGNSLTAEINKNKANISSNSTAIANTDKTIANVNSSLTAKINSNTANISKNATSIADTNKTVSSLSSTVTANYGDLNGKITSNKTAIADANKAIVNQGNSLTAKINSNAANISKNATSIADTNKTVASLSSTVTANYGDLNGKITSNKTAIADANKAIVNQNTALTAEINKNKANISSNSTAIANTNKTVSSLSSTVTSNYNGLNSKITSNTTAISEANKTIANVNSSLTAKINSNTANISKNATSIADTNKTVSSLSSTVSSNFNTLNGKITQNATSISNTNKTVSTLNSTVTANYGDLNGKISSTNSVVAGIDGRVTATTNLAQTVNGKTSGLIMVNDGNVSKTAIIADKFIISGDAGKQAVFQVVNGVASMRNALIKDLTATNIKAGSITGHSIATNTTVRAGSGAYTAGMNGDFNWKHETFWSGHDNPTHAPFRVMRDGSIYATKANITGHIVANSGTFKGHVEATSGSFTGSINATSGSFTGSLRATSGTLDNVTINSNCKINGTLNANNIVGDIYDQHFKKQTYQRHQGSPDYLNGVGSYVTVHRVTIRNSRPYARLISVEGAGCRLQAFTNSGASLASGTTEYWIANRCIGYGDDWAVSASYSNDLAASAPKGQVVVPAGISGTLEIRVYMREQRNGLRPSVFTQPSGGADTFQQFPVKAMIWKQSTELG
ncbi:phage tail tip protein [Photobacterium damselae]|uniref:phage tail tip protein n=1 Tax=Photobacterium damselae TaxID=38293 RepID=UPI00165DDCDD|nr:hypothetical protein [Photobacterium damselae]